MSNPVQTPDQRLISHPDYEAMSKEADRLRAELAALLLQRDDLRLVQGRRIEAAYLRRFGALELKVYEDYCECLRLKRKTTLLRARRNRREEIDGAEIEAELDSEFASYRAQMSEKLDEMNQALTTGDSKNRLTEAGKRELKTLYRTAVKALHPDLHPDGSEEREALLQRAMTAYQFRDLAGLRAVCEAVPGERAAEEPTMEALEAEVRELRRRVRSFNAELEQMKRSKPFSLRVYLEDEDRAAELEAELVGKLRELRERRTAFEQKIEALLHPAEDEL